MIRVCNAVNQFPLRVATAIPSRNPSSRLGVAHGAERFSSSATMMQITGSTPLPKRIKIWRQLSETNEKGCWLWTGAICRKTGYGHAGFKGKVYTVHSLVFEHYHGTVPLGLELDHLCRIRRCWNPDHLEPVTHKVNCDRGLHYWADRTHCERGHEYTSENTRIRIRGKTHERVCRACMRIYHGRSETKQQLKVKASTTQES
jgi:hypothetical protein